MLPSPRPSLFVIDALDTGLYTRLYAAYRGYDSAQNLARQGCSTPRLRESTERFYGELHRAVVAHDMGLVPDMTQGFSAYYEPRLAAFNDGIAGSDAIAGIPTAATIMRELALRLHSFRGL